MKKFLLLTAATCAAAFQASADVISYTDTFGPSATDFTDTLSLPKFNPRLGDLCAVTYTFSGVIDADILFDSENPQPSTIQVRISGNLRLLDGATTLVTLSPISSTSISVTGDNDGIPNYIGTDAGSYAAVVGDSEVVNVPFGDLALFIASPGDEWLNWSIEAEGDSRATGSGNLALLLSQDAGGSVTVRYEYNCIIPETSTYLTGLGVAGLAFAARRRFARR